MESSLIWMKQANFNIYTKFFINPDTLSKPSLHRSHMLILNRRIKYLLRKRAECDIYIYIYIYIYIDIIYIYVIKYNRNFAKMTTLVKLVNFITYSIFYLKNGVKFTIPLEIHSEMEQNDASHN